MSSLPHPHDSEHHNLLLPTPVGEPLPVPPLRQRGDRLCWAAAAQMTLHYLEFSTVKQCELADLKLNQVDFCCNLEQELFWIHCDHGVDEDEVAPIYSSAPFNIAAQFVAGTLAFADLKSELYDRQSPVQVGIIWKSSNPANRSGHMVIICGCYTDAAGKQWVYINDPLLNQTKPGRVAYQSLLNNYFNGIAGPGFWDCCWIGLTTP